MKATSNASKIKALKAAYKMAASEMDRYASSVFYVPGGSREQAYENTMHNASVALKSFGILH